MTTMKLTIDKINIVKTVAFNRRWEADDRIRTRPPSLRLAAMVYNSFFRIELETLYKITAKPRIN